MFSFLPALPEGFPLLPHCTWEIRTYLIFLAADSPTTFPVSPVVAALERRGRRWKLEFLLFTSLVFVSCLT